MRSKRTTGQATGMFSSLKDESSVYKLQKSFILLRGIYLCVVVQNTFLYVQLCPISEQFCRPAMI